MLRLIKKHTDTLVDQTKTSLQITLDFVMGKRMETVSFSPQINLFEEGKWFLAVISLKATNSVFNITDENNSSSISAPSYWTPEDGEEFINELKKLLELLSENDSELHVTEVEKRGNRSRRQWFKFSRV